MNAIAKWFCPVDLEHNSPAELRKWTNDKSKRFQFSNIVEDNVELKQSTTPGSNSILYSKRCGVHQVLQIIFQLLAMLFRTSMAKTCTRCNLNRAERAR